MATKRVVGHVAPLCTSVMSAHSFAPHISLKSFRGRCMYVRMYGNAPLNTSGTSRAINSSWQKTFPVSCRTCEIKANCDAMPISSHLYVKYVDVRIAARMSRFLDAIKTWIYLMEYWQTLLPRILSVAFIYDVTSLFVSAVVVVWNNIKCSVFLYWRNNALFPHCAMLIKMRMK
jgi:hypothetical protein